MNDTTTTSAPVRYCRASSAPCRCPACVPAVQRIEDAGVLERDPVTRPAHYALDPEPLDVIEAWGLPYHEGNVLKYIVRWRDKGGVQDLRKAAEYLRRLIALAERKGAGRVDVAVPATPQPKA